MCTLINVLFYIKSNNQDWICQLKYLFIILNYIIRFATPTPRETDFPIPKQSRNKKSVLNIPVKPCHFFAFKV